MVRENLQAKRPSQDEVFANRVQLFNAIEAGQVEKAKALLLATPALVNATTEGGQTPLHVAASYGHKGIMEPLIANGADVNARDNRGRTPLHHMISSCTRPDVTELLVKNGARVNTTDNIGTTPISLAADGHSRNGGYWPISEFLIDNGATVDIFVATVFCPPEKVEAMLRADASLANARQKAGHQWAGATPLHYAVKLGQIGDVRALLKYGADVKALDDRGCPPLYFVSQFRAPRWLSTPSQMVQLLLEHGAEMDIFASACLG